MLLAVVGVAMNQAHANVQRLDGGARKVGVHFRIDPVRQRIFRFGATAKSFQQFVQQQLVGAGRKQRGDVGRFSQRLETLAKVVGQRWRRSGRGGGKGSDLVNLAGLHAIEAMLFA
ncbi:MAG: hypothetical protein BWZ10_01131 [candidate division BRC1 bacterium ADurb.BinA364]|nr:MAG: hypothetical protein BWZ10_01131 [candidate division BRC1 bacterium ADurb.BinA364]